MRAGALTMISFSLLLLAQPAFACPSCAEGRAARRQLWQDDFARNLLGALLPFLLIGAIGAQAESIGRRRTPAEPASERADDGAGPVDPGSISRRPSP